MEEHLQNWLSKLKLNLGYSDNSRDELLMNYMEIAHKNIWTQYYKLKLTQEDFIPESHPWSFDNQTMLAVIHLAAGMASNPDNQVTSQGTIIKADHIKSILGSRMSYE